MFVFSALFIQLFQKKGGEHHIVNESKREHAIEWYSSGAALEYSNYINLIPPLQYRRGCLWSNAVVNNATISLDFSIDNGIGPQIGFWLLSSRTLMGPIHGGPSSYHGISILMNFTKDFTTDIFILSSNQNYIDNFSIEIPKDRHFFLDIQTSINEVNISLNGHEKNVRIPFKGGVFGITAQNERSVGRIDLFSYQIKGKYDISDFSPKVFSDGKFFPESIPLLRSQWYDKALHPDFNDQASSSDVMDIISEINRAMYDVASFSELNYFVKSTITPFAQKWHKRTIKMIEDSQRARNIYGKTWNYTEEMIKGLKQSLKKAKLELIKSEELMANEILQNPPNHGIIFVSLEANAYDADFYIMYITLFELLCLMTFFLIIKNPIIQTKIIDGTHRKRRIRKRNKIRKTEKNILNVL